MSLEEAGDDELVGALGTLVRLLAGVRAHVIGERAALGEVGATELTAEGPLAGVGAQVVLQVGQLDEARLAVRARVRPGAAVHSSVGGQRGPLGEGLSADLAA